jgi:nitrogen regulatory protein P-II 1
MKKIEAIIRPTKLEELKEALQSINLDGITISQVMGAGKQKGYKEYFRGTEIILNVLPKVMVTFVVCDNRLDEVVNLIVEHCKTGEVGDGKIFVTDIYDVIRIRTNERGESAL